MRRLIKTGRTASTGQFMVDQATDARKGHSISTIEPWSAIRRRGSVGQSFRQRRVPNLKLMGQFYRENPAYLKLCSQRLPNWAIRPQLKLGNGLLPNCLWSESRGDTMCY